MIEKATEVQLRQDKKTHTIQLHGVHKCTVHQSDLSKRRVFSLWRKMLTVSAFLTDSGREFHSLGAAPLKGLAPRLFFFLSPVEEKNKGEIESWSEKNGLEHTSGWLLAAIQGLSPCTQE